MLYIALIFIIFIHLYLFKEQAKLLKLFIQIDIFCTLSIIFFILFNPIQKTDITQTVNFIFICWLSLMIILLILRYKLRKKYEKLFYECKNISSYKRKLQIEKCLKVKFDHIESAEIKLFKVDDLKSIRIQEIKYKDKKNLIFKDNYIYKNPDYCHAFTLKAESAFDKDFLKFWYYLLLEIDNNLTYQEIKNLTSLNYKYSPNKDDLLEECVNNQIKLNNKFLEEIKC